MDGAAHALRSGMREQGREASSDASRPCVVHAGRRIPVGVHERGEVAPGPDAAGRAREWLALSTVCLFIPL